MKKKPNKLDDRQLGKIIDLLCSPYTSDDFWLGVQMILSTNVSQQRFTFLAAKNSKTVPDIIHMTFVVYHNSSVDPNHIEDVEKALRNEFYHFAWKRKATPHLSWDDVGYVDDNDIERITEWQAEWKKRRPSWFFVLSQRFDEVLSSWLEDGDAKHKVRIFFTLESILLKLERAVINSRDLVDQAKLAEKKASWQYIRKLTRITVGYNRNEGSPGFISLSQYSDDSIARLKFFKWELEQERKKK